MELSLENFVEFCKEHIHNPDAPLVYPADTEDFVDPRALIFGAPVGEQQAVELVFDGDLDIFNEALVCLIEYRTDVYVSFTESALQLYPMAPILLDTMYGAAMQLAARLPDREEFVVDIGLLHLTIPHEHFSSQQYFFIGTKLMVDLMDLISSHPLSYQYFFNQNNLTKQEVLDALGYFLPCCNSNVYAEHGNGFLESQPMINFNFGYSGKMPFHRINRILNLTDVQLFPECASVFKEKHKILEILYDYSYKLFDDVARTHFIDIIEYNRIYITTED